METIQKSPMGNPPDNHLVWAILSTIFCCMPLGIVSIIKSSKVKELWSQGDTEGALRSAKEAKKWATYSAIAYFVILIPLMLLMFFGFFGAIMSNGTY